MEIPQDPKEADKLLQRMLLTHYTMRYVIPILVSQSEALRTHILGLIQWNDEAREEFSHHLKVFKGTIPKVADKQMEDDAYPLRKVNSNLLMQINALENQARLREHDLLAIMSVCGSPEGGWDEIVDIVTQGLEQVSKDSQDTNKKLRKLIAAMWKEFGAQIYLPLPKKLLEEILSELKLLDEDSK